MPKSDVKRQQKQRGILTSSRAARKKENAELLYFTSARKARVSAVPVNVNHLHSFSTRTMCQHQQQYQANDPISGLLDRVRFTIKPSGTVAVLGSQLYHYDAFRITMVRYLPSPNSSASAT
ncbi:hypothetical protein BaRGS_00010816 [Batillaria attramentaria]|uniref:Uncharacterized protein n=1 Tax=Batillaria attramentaria TaxID=370345 RepID=A0ABD0LEQ2_9CAEN